MKNIKDNNLIKSHKFKTYLTFVLTFVVMFGILVTAVAPKTHSFNESDIAPYDIKAPRDVEDKVTTERLREEAVKRIEPANSYKVNVKEETMLSIDNLFSKVIEINRDTKLDNKNESSSSDSSDNNLKHNENGTETTIDSAQLEKDLLELKLDGLKKALDIELSDENFIILLQLSPKEFKELKEYLFSVMSRLYDEVNINELKEKSEDKLDDLYNIKPGDLSNAERFIESNFNKSIFSKDIKELGKSIGYHEIRPNLIYDAEKTAKMREEARNSVESVMIREGQLIVKEGEPVTNAQIEVLKSLELLDEKSGFIWYIYAGLAILIIVVILLQWLYLYKYHNEVFNNPKILSLISIVNCISLILARVIYIISPSLIPLAFAPMLLTLLINDNVAIAISVINSVLISISAGFALPVTILAILNAVVGAVFLRNMEQRNDILYSSVFIAIINGVVISAIEVLQVNTVFIDVLVKFLLVFVGGIVSGILTIGFLPFLESIFDIVTNVKLLELSNPNHPLLKKLLLEAPGTYHHSVLVANLSELAAQAIGANSVLARVAANYHDVGKLKRPYFFKENQRGENPHDKITPNLSTLIIISHVKDGIELAKEYKLPKAIIDVIQQHHGITLVKYFYITMKNTSDKPEDVKEEDFRYSGPIPNSKEAGIIMLADSVEAAVRSINDPTKGKIEEMVNNIIKGKLNDGQLDNCDLTLKDLDKIRKAFLKGLSGIYHERIEYPKLTNKN